MGVYQEYQIDYGASEMDNLDIRAIIIAPTNPSLTTYTRMLLSVRLVKKDGEVYWLLNQIEQFFGSRIFPISNERQVIIKNDLPVLITNICGDGGDIDQPYNYTSKFTFCPEELEEGYKRLDQIVSGELSLQDLIGEPNEKSR